MANVSQRAPRSPSRGAAAARYRLFVLCASLALTGLAACSNVVPYERLTPEQQGALISSAPSN